MGDIHCKKCGEPWDSYGVRFGDMTKQEARRFLLGEGCPCCKFGTDIPEDGGLSSEEMEDLFWESFIDNLE